MINPDDSVEWLARSLAFVRGRNFYRFSPETREFYMEISRKAINAAADEEAFTNGDYGICTMHDD